MLIPYLISHITQVSFSEFVIDGHHYTSPNQQKPPSSVSFSESQSLPDPVSPTELRKRVWAAHNLPYLPFVLNSPFHGAMTSRLATPPEQIPLEKGKSGYHLPHDVGKSWKTLEKTLREIGSILHSSFRQDHPKINLSYIPPRKPSEFGYFDVHPSEEIARSALSKSLDAFVILFAHVSFCIAICRSVSDTPSLSSSTPESMPRWFQDLSVKNRIHPEWLRLLADSPIANFTTAPQRLGTIVNVARCSWLHLIPWMMKANVPIWFYWGLPPAFAQPLVAEALAFAPRSHPQSRAPPALPPSQPVGPRVPSGHAGPGQLPGETWKEFIMRQNKRRKAKLANENDQQRMAREGREVTATKRQCPGKRGPTVYIWEEENGVWTRILLNRGEVEGYWGQFFSSQKIYNSLDNCWDLCLKFDDDTAGEVEDEYDSNDSDNDIIPNRKKQSHRSPTPKNGRLSDAPDCSPMVVDPTPHPVPMPPQVASDCPPMVVQSTPLSVLTPAPVASDPLPMIVDPTPHPVPMPPQVASDCPPTVVQSTPLPVLTPAPVASDPLPMAVNPTPNVASNPLLMVGESTLPVSSPASVAAHDLQHPNPLSGDFIGADEDDEDIYEASKQDVLNAYSFVALDLEPMPITTLDDLIYYRYGFSLNENPYTGIPSLLKAETYSFRSWAEVCRAVGGQQLESSALNCDAIEDFLSILAKCGHPFKDVPGKYWDLSPLGKKPIVGLSKVFILIKEMQFMDGVQYSISPDPRFLDPSRDTSWFITVDAMTALECIRRGLGPHTIDVANFLITHGVRFRTLQRIRDSPDSEKLPVPPSRPQCWYLGYRSLNYLFDLADFAGYEALRDSYLRSQPHGPLALRQGGIVARLAREVLPNSNALSGHTSEALGGHCARFVCNDKIYVDDYFSEAELQLICGTYALGNTHNKSGMRIFPQLSCY